MSTWHLFSDAGAEFRWQVAGRALHGKRKDPPNAAANQPPSPGTRLPSMEDLLLQGCSKLEENNNDDVGRAPMFRTELGKSVALKQSSITRALSVLGNDDDAPIRSGCLTGEKRTTGNINGVTNSLFCTGSGKSVSVSPAGLVRATTLLGLEENNSISSYQGFQNPRKSFDANDSEGQRFSHLKAIEEMTNSEIWDTVSVSGQYMISRPNLEESNLSDIVHSNSFHQEIQNSIPKVPPIKFQTAGGRSLSVSSDALERAKSLLGGPDLGSFLNDEYTVDTSVPFSSVNKSNESSSYKATNFRPSFTYPTAMKSKTISKTFVPPLRSTGIQNKSSLNSENIILGVDLSKKFDAVDDDKVCESPSSILSKQRSLSNGICRPGTVEQNLLAKESSRSNLPKSSCGPLVDISNTIGVTNHRHYDGERKRLGRGASVSPFKKPRTSKFSPLP